MTRAKVDLMAVTSGEVDERALEEAETQGKKVKALGLCAPHSQFGRCYAREVLENYARSMGSAR